jgi:putative ATP-dependent endonuclease of the OLD family
MGMFLRRLHVKNYRTLVNFQAAFSSNYTAICGKNNSGKSNIIRAIRSVLGWDRGGIWGIDDSAFQPQDLTVWALDESDQSIRITVELELDPQFDVGLVMFVARILQMPSEDHPSMIIGLDTEFRPKEKSATTSVMQTNISVNGKAIEDAYASQEIARRIKNSVCCIFHNSTTVTPTLSSMKRVEHSLPVCMKIIAKY